MDGCRSSHGNVKVIPRKQKDWTWPAKVLPLHKNKHLPARAHAHASRQHRSAGRLPGRRGLLPGANWAADRAGCLRLFGVVSGHVGSGGLVDHWVSGGKRQGVPEQISILALLPGISKREAGNDPRDMQLCPAAVAHLSGGPPRLCLESLESCIKDPGSFL